MVELLENSGNWYKGNLHMHTTRSDGHLSPEDAANLYQKAGYDFIAITDHWKLEEYKSTDNFLILNGCEYNTGDMINSPIFHIIGVGMEKKPELKLDITLPPQALIDAIKEAKGIAILAHPAWSVTDPWDCMKLNGLSGMEIYNSVSNLPWNGRRADSSLYFDLCATQGKCFPCMAADDSHYYNGEETYSFIRVNAKELTRDAIMKALIDGNFYASQGPSIDSIRLNNGKIEVKCSQVETIVFYSNSIWCADRVATGNLSSATYEIKPEDRYVRVELIDQNGNMAWSSPYPVNNYRKG